MRQFITIIALILVANIIFAQSLSKKNNVFLELAGNGIYCSLNYERIVTNNNKFSFRVGAGYYSGDQKFRMSLPFGVNYLLPLRKGNSFIDFGLGGTWASAPGLKNESRNGVRDYSEHIINFIPSVGYRVHTKRDLMYRVSITPLVNKYRTIPSIGLSIGKLF